MTQLRGLWLSKLVKKGTIWLSGLGVILQSLRSPVQFPVRAHAWVAAWFLVGVHAKGNRWVFLSLSLALPSPLSKNKEIKSLKRKERMLQYVNKVVSQLCLRKGCACV